MNTGAIRIAHIGGIAIDIHITFFLVLVWGAWQGWTLNRTVAGAAYGLGAILLLFFCVLLHELGHGLAARALGLHVRQIIILPIGGMAQLATSPSYPWHELLITLAGPMVNLGIALIAAPVAFLLTPFTPAAWAYDLLLLSPAGAAGLLRYLLWTNLILFAFNMIPAFPMDGGRILRAALAILTDYEAATRVAATIGRGLALLLGIYGLLQWRNGIVSGGIFLVVVALLVFYGARYEDIYVRRRRALVRLEVADVCQLPAQVLHPWDVLSVVLIRRLARGGHALPVIVDGRLVGVLTEREVFRLLGAGRKLTIAHIMRPDFPVLELTDTLWVAYQYMIDSQLASLPVVANGDFKGMVTLEHLRTAWRIRGEQRQ